MGMEVASGRAFPPDSLKTLRRQGRKPPCLFHRQAPGEEACQPREEHHLGKKLEPVRSRPLVGLSSGSCYAKLFYCFHSIFLSFIVAFLNYIRFFFMLNF